MSDVTTILFWLALISAPAFMTFIASHVRNAALRDTLNAAASRAGGIAYAFLQQQTAQGVAMPSVEQAISLGVNHLRTATPDTVGSLGISGLALENIVRGELGKLLAADPNTVAAPKVSV
jgi:hypothetical protein